MFSINKQNRNYNPSFTRGLRPNEVKSYTQSISKGLKVLDKEIDLIVHNSCAPSVPSQNTGIGSLLSKTYENKMIPFLKKHVLTSVQQEPDGLRLSNGSPYESDTFAKNILTIPLEKLKSEEYGSILKTKTFNNIVKSRPDKKSNMVDYNYVIPKYNEALHEAFSTFKEKSQNISSLPKIQAKAIKNLSKEFNSFKKENGVKLEKNAIYNVLAEEHGNTYWKNWGSDLDKSLYSPKNSDKELAVARIQEIKIKNADKIDEFLFNQMLISKAKKEIDLKNAKNGIKTIGDSAVAFSNIDVWANQKVFKKDWNLGCPPDMFSTSGQAWGFSIIEPKTLFNKDGTLGEGGKLLSEKYEVMFKDNPGGVRIDHVLGLIDPFVYKSSPTSKSAGRLYSSPNNPELKNYAKKSTDEYANIIEKIVIPAANRAGLNSKAIIAEDLGEVTPPAQEVLKKLQLRGISLTQFSDGGEYNCYRGKNIPAKNIAMIGSHDNISFVEWTNNLFRKSEKNNLKQQAKGLAEDVFPVGPETKTITKNLMNSKKKFMSAKFAELFTSPAKKIQVFFIDFLGDNRTYNFPGQPEKKSWAIRMSSGFEKMYHKNLEKGKGLNLPEVLATAIRQKGDAFALKNKNLLKKLDKFAQILKEKEPSKI